MGTGRGTFLLFECPASHGTFRQVEKVIWAMNCLVWGFVHRASIIGRAGLKPCGVLGPRIIKQTLEKEEDAASNC